MMPSVHISVGMVAGALVWAVTRNILDVTALMVGAVLIDVDHYLAYLWRFRDTSLKRAMIWFKERTDVPRLCFCIFHTIEFMALFVALTVVTGNRLLLMVLIGMLVHLALDLIQVIQIHKVGGRWWSLTHYLLCRDKEYKKKPS